MHFYGNMTFQFKQLLIFALIIENYFNYTSQEVQKIQLPRYLLGYIAIKSATIQACQLLSRGEEAIIIIIKKIYSEMLMLSCED